MTRKDLQEKWPLFFVDTNNDGRLVVATPAHDVIEVRGDDEQMDTLDALHNKFRVMSGYKKLFPEFTFYPNGLVTFADETITKVYYTGEYDELSELGALSGEFR